MKATVDPDVCIGCQLCTEMCPEVFRMADDKAEVYVNTVPEKNKETAKKAAEDCPVEAITVEE